MSPRIRVGIDTGGTFTDVVAVDEGTGELAVTKTPSTPADPAVGFMNGVHKVLDALGLGGDAVSAVSHGTTVATNRLLEGKVENLGFVTTEGYEFMLEIARQSVPDGYGNSYFWVKPDRIVPVHRVRTVGGRLSVDGAEVRPFDEKSAVAAARFFRDAGINTIGVCFLHAYVDDAHELAMRDVLAREHPDATVSISSEVLREYREYERAVTTLVDAAVKPDIRRYVATIARRLGGLVHDGAGVPFYVMKSNGGVLSADEVVDQPITTVLSGPAAGALGAAVVAQAAGLPAGGDPRRRRHLDRRHRGRRRPPGADHRGHRRGLPEQDPDDRRRHGRGRRRVRGVALPGGHPQGGAAQRGRRSRADLLRQRRHRAHDHRRARAARPDPAAPARRRGAARRRPRRAGRRRAGRAARASRGRRAPPASWRSPRGTRPTRCGRSPCSAASTSATSRW